MATVGDIVRYQDKVWKVSGHNRDYGTFVLVNFEAERVEVTAMEPLEVLYATSAWPFVALPAKAFKSGRITEVRRRNVSLRPMFDWVPSDLIRAGGSLFFSPELRLQVGEVLVAKHEKGSLIRVSITRAFGTGTQRKRRKERPWKPPAPVTVYDRLTGRSPFDDEDEDF
jgi:hypothetical protein